MMKNHTGEQRARAFVPAAVTARDEFLGEQNCIISRKYWNGGRGYIPLAGRAG
jgi:hypothetical protein